jgi:hypothetical protein
MSHRPSTGTILQITWTIQRSVILIFISTTITHYNRLILVNLNTTLSFVPVLDQPLDMLSRVLCWLSVQDTA